MMSTAADALKKALELEKKALECYKEAIAHAKHAETKDTIEKIIAERTPLIDSLHWVAMAEAGQLESDAAPGESSEAKEADAAKPSSKCPFSGALAEMGIDIDKMGDMAGKDMDMSKMGDMAKMMGIKPPEENTGS